MMPPGTMGAAEGHSKWASAPSLPNGRQVKASLVIPPSEPVANPATEMTRRTADVSGKNAAGREDRR